MNAIRPTNGFRASLAEPEKTNLAGLDEPSHCPDRFLDRDQRINAVLVVQINRLDAETFEARVTRADYVLRSSVVDFSAAPAEIAKLRGYKNFGTPPCDGLAYQRFI